MQSSNHPSCHRTKWRLAAYVYLLTAHCQGKQLDSGSLQFALVSRESSSWPVVQRFLSCLLGFPLRCLVVFAGMFTASPSLLQVFNSISIISAGMFTPLFLWVCSFHFHLWRFCRLCSLHLHRFCRYVHSISIVPAGMFTSSPSFLQVCSLHLHRFCRYVHSISIVFAGMFTPSPSFLQVCSFHLHRFCRYVHSISIVFAGMFIPSPSSLHSPFPSMAFSIAREMAALLCDVQTKHQFVF